ncbi:MAG TPA: nucleoside hydrolase [Thermoanaerobaculia bacterium]|nr:nucleoside hydrolase [Thermoanaerobaculia bacterium]
MSGRDRPRVWVDTDVALGAPRGDVDDGFALAALLAAHRRGWINLVGISTVFGNATAAVSGECARELVRGAGTAVPVVPGAEKPNRETAAAEAIAGLPSGVELLCLGPLTNVTMACRRNPGLARGISLRAVGGNLTSRGFLPPLWPHEFNLARDREGALAVLGERWESLTFYPLDVVRRLDVGGEELGALGDRGSLGRTLAEGSRRWLLRARWRHPLRRRFPLWDLPAALDLLGLLSGEFAERSPARGAGRYFGSGRELRFLVSFEAARAWSRFLDLLVPAEVA